MYGRLDPWDQITRVALDGAIAACGKRIDGVEVGRRVLIVNWKTRTGCRKRSHVIDVNLKRHFPIIIHRAKGEIVREFAA